MKLMTVIGVKVLTSPVTCSLKPSRPLSSYVFNKLRDASTIAPRVLRKKNAQKLKIPKADNKPKWTSKDWLIECKRPEFNLPKHVNPSKSKDTQLASHAWHNRHSNGDYFIIHPTEKPENIQSTVTETFQDTKLAEQIVSAVHNLGYKNPTLAQWLSMPPILAGKHTRLAAETGCGKTLAYLLPMIHQVLEWKSLMPEKINAPLGLVITPNRELVKQTFEIASQLAETLPFTPHHFVGGSTKRKMLNPTFENMDILIGTPSVLSKLTTVKVLDMDNVRHVVLDEADTLLDDSFSGYVKNFLSKLQIHAECTRQRGMVPEGAQITLASATFPRDVEEILGDFMDENTFESITTPGLHRLMPQVTQKFMRMGKIHKPEQLLKHAKMLQASKTPTLIFSNKSATSKFVTLFLKDHGIEVPCYCKDMPADLRHDTFRKFQTGLTPMLSTTDIASRGLNTIKAQVVLNYDFPLFMADYVHRCGRVGRLDSEASGKVINFVNGPAEIKNVHAIEQAIRSQSPIENVNGNISKIMEDWNENRENREFNQYVKRASS